MIINHHSLLFDVLTWLRALDGIFAVYIPVFNFMKYAYKSGQWFWEYFLEFEV
jgi:hypothetical protein